jgi:hypothetical protein
MRSLAAATNLRPSGDGPRSAQTRKLAVENYLITQVGTWTSATQMFANVRLTRGQLGVLVVRKRGFYSHGHGKTNHRTGWHYRMAPALSPATDGVGGCLATGAVCHKLKSSLRVNAFEKKNSAAGPISGRIRGFAKRCVYRLATDVKWTAHDPGDFGVATPADAASGTRARG